jgi:uncharacterized membrane protein YfcA
MHRPFSVSKGVIFTFWYLALKEAGCLANKGSLDHRQSSVGFKKERFTVNITEFSLLTFLGSMTAGFLGALTGLGGGVVIVPLLSLVFGVDIRYAIGASLISVIATSCGAAAAYVKEGFSNIRLGMFLEMATTFGALFGAALAVSISTHSIAVIFGMVLLYSAFLSTRGHPIAATDTDDTHHFLPRSLHLDAAYPGSQGPIYYHVHAIPTGFSLMFLAGALSGLLGIGSGAVKVLAMNDKRPAISDARIDKVIGGLLRVGAVVSSLVVMIGGSLYLKRHGTELPNYHMFYGEPTQLRSVSGIIRDASSFSGRGIIQFGLLLLIATPVMRVAFAIVAFIIQRDRIYVGVTLIVLSVLLFSLAGGGQ